MSSMEKYIRVAQTQPKPPGQIQTSQKPKQKLANSMPVLLALELLDNCEIKVDELLDDSNDVI